MYIYIYMIFNNTVNNSTRYTVQIRIIILILTLYYYILWA